MRGRPFGSSQRFNITYKSLSNVTGLSINTLRKYASQKKFDPDDLISLLEFVAKYRKKK